MFLAQKNVTVKTLLWKQSLQYLKGEWETPLMSVQQDRARLFLCVLRKHGKFSLSKVHIWHFVSIGCMLIVQQWSTRCLEWLGIGTGQGRLSDLEALWHSMPFFRHQGEVWVDTRYLCTSTLLLPIMYIIIVHFVPLFWLCLQVDGHMRSLTVTFFIIANNLALTFLCVIFTTLAG